jgi:hypothetical protein
LNTLLRIFHFISITFREYNYTSFFSQNHKLKIISNYCTPIIPPALPLPVVWPILVKNSLGNKHFVGEEKKMIYFWEEELMNQTKEGKEGWRSV